MVEQKAEEEVVSHQDALISLHDQMYEECLRQWQKDHREFNEDTLRVRAALIQLKDKGWKIAVVHPGSRVRLALDLKACQIATITTVVVSGEFRLIANQHNRFVKEKKNGDAGASLSKAARPYKNLYDEAVSRLGVDPATVLTFVSWPLDVLVRRTIVWQGGFY